jgi:hypothetical protein
VPSKQAPGQMLICITFDAGPLGDKMEFEQAIEIALP